MALGVSLQMLQLRRAAVALLFYLHNTYSVNVVSAKYRNDGCKRPLDILPAKCYAMRREGGR